MKIAIESWAASDLEHIEAKSKAQSLKRMNKQKELMSGLKGAKYFYSMSR
jgi:hypothetical protein